MVYSVVDGAMMYIVLLLCCIFGALLAECGGENISVSTGQGRLSGSYSTSSSGRKFAAFRGIPYGEPPIGRLRFKDPVPAAPWFGVLDVTGEGPICISRNPFNLIINGTEDCLKLNVYTHQVIGMNDIDPFDVNC